MRWHTHRAKTQKLQNAKPKGKRGFYSSVLPLWPCAGPAQSCSFPVSGWNLESRKYKIIKHSSVFQPEIRWLEIAIQDRVSWVEFPVLVPNRGWKLAAGNCQQIPAKRRRTRPRNLRPETREYFQQSGTDPTKIGKWAFWKHIGLPD